MQHNELVQDFIFRDLPSTSNKRDFNQRMQSFLERIPNHFGQVQVAGVLRFLLQLAPAYTPIILLSQSLSC